MTGSLPKANSRHIACLLVVIALINPAPAQAAKLEHRRSSVQRTASQPEPGVPRPVWHVLETANFRVLSYGTHPVAASAGQACETLRTELYAKWIGDDSAADWLPKCDVVLHPTDASYLREVGAGAASTVASSLIDQLQGQIRTRRIDVRTSDSDWQTAALPHELTHVVLAGRFAGRALPRWIDEGAAILADPTAKRLGHKQEITAALANRSAFRIVELVTLDDYPAAHRWGTFYCQSASVVEYLVSQKSPADFVQFVELALDEGYDTSLRKVYGIAGIAGLERNWQAQTHLSQPRISQPRTIQASAPIPTGGRPIRTAQPG
jgi:hypothetical protein